MNELAAEPRAAQRAIERLRLIPVLFELGARPYPPRDLYLAYIRQSHVFVGVYGQQYGWIAPGTRHLGSRGRVPRSGRSVVLHTMGRATENPKPER